jgi:hypothetical protein
MPLTWKEKTLESDSKTWRFFKMRRDEEDQETEKIKPELNRHCYHIYGKKDCIFYQIAKCVSAEMEIFFQDKVDPFDWEAPRRRWNQADNFGGSTVTMREIDQAEWGQVLQNVKHEILGSPAAAHKGCPLIFEGCRGEKPRYIGGCDEFVTMMERKFGYIPVHCGRLLTKYLPHHQQQIADLNAKFDKDTPGTEISAKLREQNQYFQKEREEKIKMVTYQLPEELRQQWRDKQLYAKLALQLQQKEDQQQEQAWLQQKIAEGQQTKLRRKEVVPVRPSLPPS